MPENRVKPKTSSKPHHHSGGAGVFKSEERLRAALQTLLDQVDYTKGACSVTEMVGAVLPKEVIEICQTVLEETK